MSLSNAPQSPLLPLRRTLLCGLALAAIVACGSQVPESDPAVRTPENNGAEDASAGRLDAPTGGAFGTGGTTSDGGTATGGANTAGAASAGGNPATAGATGTGDSPKHGTVHFTAAYKTQSKWSTPEADLIKANVETLLRDFEAHLRTGGAFTANIELCFFDEFEPGYATKVASGFAMYATPKDRPTSVVQLAGGGVEVQPVWVDIVQGGVDPNGDEAATADTMSGCDAYIFYNFERNQNQPNNGVLRHELLHALSVSSNQNPAISDQNVRTGSLGGTKLTPTVLDLTVVDDADHRFALLDAASGAFIVNPAFSFYATHAQWKTPNARGKYSSGASIVGLDEAGLPVLLNPILRGTDAAFTTLIAEFTHPEEAMFDRPDYDILTPIDLALLRAIRYTVVP